MVTKMRTEFFVVVLTLALMLVIGFAAQAAAAGCLSLEKHEEQLARTKCSEVWVGEGGVIITRLYMCEDTSWMILNFYPIVVSGKNTFMVCRTHMGTASVMRKQGTDL